MHKLNAETIEKIKRLTREGLSIRQIQAKLREEGKEISIYPIWKVQQSMIIDELIPSDEKTVYEELKDLAISLMKEIKADLEDIKVISDATVRLTLRNQTIAKLRELTDILLQLEAKSPLKEITELRDKYNKLLNAVLKASKPAREEILDLMRESEKK